MKTESKTKLLSALLGVVLNSLVSSQAQIGAPANSKTNTYSIGDFSGSGVEREVVYYNSRILGGQLIPEILPADQDSGGNWGAPTDGLQLSVRFRREEFLKKEPVLAVIIVRNLNSTPREIRMPDFPFEFTLHYGTNTTEWRRPKAAPIEGSNSGFFYTIPARSEALVVAHLDQLFDLSHLGEYSVQARFPQPMSNTRTFEGVQSGTATFKIVEALSPAAIAATNAYFHTIEEGSRRYRESLQRTRTGEMGTSRDK